MACTHSVRTPLTWKNQTHLRTRIWTRIVAKAHSLTISAGNAKRHEVFKKMGYLPADPSDIKLRVLPSYTFVPMSEVEQHV